jgi:hypothetical protein
VRFSRADEAFVHYGIAFKGSAGTRSRLARSLATIEPVVESPERVIISPERANRAEGGTPEAICQPGASARNDVSVYRRRDVDQFCDLGEFCGRRSVPRCAYRERNGTPSSNPAVTAQSIGFTSPPPLRRSTLSGR